jgi:hypothetical protein
LHGPKRDDAMMSVKQLTEWVRSRTEQDETLYDRYGKPLEAQHSGEFVAISDDGRTLLGTEELALTKRAAAEFGPGQFALRRIGHDAEVRWREIV